MKLRCAGLTARVGEDGFEYMKKHGVWQDMTKPKYYALFGWELSASQMKDARVDEKTGDIFKAVSPGAAE